MNKLLNLFYQLPLWLIFCCAVVLSHFFRKVWLRDGSRPWFRTACVLALLFWCYLLARLTLLYRPLGYENRCFLMPLHFLLEMYQTGNTELPRTMFMNAVLFFPAGLLLAALADRSRPWTRTAGRICLLLLAVSLAVECCQRTLQIGRFETDDILFNGLGAYLGTRVLRPEQH